MLSFQASFLWKVRSNCNTLVQYIHLEQMATKDFSLFMSLEFTFLNLIGSELEFEERVNATELIWRNYPLLNALK